MIIVVIFFSGISIGVTLGSLLAEWSMKKYPEYWIKWIKEKGAKK